MRGRLCLCLAPVVAITPVLVQTASHNLQQTTTFQALLTPHTNLAKTIHQNLIQQNLTTPNQLQTTAFQTIFTNNKDTLIHAPTGAGKTIAFLLPILAKLQQKRMEPQALVLCPSRELAYQTQRVAAMLMENTDLNALCIAGGANPGRQIEKLRKIRPQLLIGTAGRINELAFETRKISLRKLSFLVLDEVDEAMVPPHLEHTLRIIEHTRSVRCGALQLAFASATCDTPAVRRAAYQLMKEPHLLRLAEEDKAGASLPDTITHGLVLCQSNKLIETLTRFSRTTPTPKALIFVNSPRRARVVCELLQRYGVAADAVYGNQEREERVSVMRDFVSNRVNFVVTTELGARGLDIPDLSHVINLELPTDETHYVHRAGRCGRGGSVGVVVSIVGRGEAHVVRKHASRLGVDLSEMRVHAGHLEKVPVQAARN